MRLPILYFGVSRKTSYGAPGEHHSLWHAVLPSGKTCPTGSRLCTCMLSSKCCSLLHADAQWRDEPNAGDRDATFLFGGVRRHVGCRFICHCFPKEIFAS